MFNFFNKSEYIVPEKTVTPQPLINIYEPALYTIGVNDHGMTQLIVRGDEGQYTLSMDPRAVRHLIKMLQCTLDEDQINDNQ